MASPALLPPNVPTTALQVLFMRSSLLTFFRDFSFRMLLLIRRTNEKRKLLVVVFDIGVELQSLVQYTYSVM